MKKICFITAARSEYGLMKWLMYDVQKSQNFIFQLIVTGGHLLVEQGHTIDQIIEDGFAIDEIVDPNLCLDKVETIAESMGRLAEKIANAFSRLQPDCIIILGDRYELLPICNTAFIMRIPIVHLGGGDVTEGAIDDGVRNAITMLADYHFPGTIDSKNNIVRMRGTNKNIWNVGELGLDSFRREKLLSREQLAQNIGLNIEYKWALMTYHAETKQSLEENISVANHCIDALKDLEEYQIVITFSNADFGGKEINNLFLEFAKTYPERFIVIPSLGNLRYLSYMKQVKFVIGNSSSGIVEAPALDVPVINIGDRQKGRYQCDNIIQCGRSYEDIREAMHKVDEINKKEKKDLNYWGDGQASERVVKILKDIL